MKIEIDDSLLSVYKVLSKKTGDSIDQLTQTALLIYPIIRALPNEQQALIIAAIQESGLTL